MARTFDGIDDTVTSTITGPSDGDWTQGCWFYAVGGGEGSIGSPMFGHVGGAARTVWRFTGAGLTLVTSQVYSTTNAQVTGSRAYPLNAWQCVFSVHRGSDNSLHQFWGTLANPVTEDTYSATQSGVGTYTSGATTLVVGNNAANSSTWNGRIERPFWVPWEMTIGEMERFRQGSVSVLYDHGKPIIFLPLTSPTASQAEDLSGNGANGTVVGATGSDSPPVPFRWSA